MPPWGLEVRGSSKSDVPGRRQYPPDAHIHPCMSEPLYQLTSMYEQLKVLRGELSTCTDLSEGAHGSQILPDGGVDTQGYVRLV